MTSPTVPSQGGPITHVPYDVLVEIFTHCLPQSSPIKARPPQWRWYQPDTRVAPILLCHICSSWRKLALASVRLWTHLSFVHKNINSSELGKQAIKFIRWWKTNQGQIPPSLSLRLSSYHTFYTVVDVPLTPGSNGAFLLGYITTAQYLELDSFYCFWIYTKLKHGNLVVVFSNLHTVVVRNKENGILETSAFYQIQRLLPAHAFPALRRLSITDPESLHDFTIPAHWSALTHLSLRISITPVFWLSLIRAVRHLQFGCFDLAAGTSFPLSSIEAHTPPPCPQCTLPNLTSLSISLHCTSGVPFLVPLSILFTRLHLPSLRTLSLSAPDAKVWENHYALREVYTVLSGAPAVSRLALEYTRQLYQVDTPTIALPPTTEPIWAYVTELTHLQLALPPKFMETEEREDILRLFVHHIFSPANIWLDLHNPACPIQAITISDSRSRRPISDLTRSSIRESAGQVPEVRFEVISESAREAAADMRKEWGAGR